MAVEELNQLFLYMLISGCALWVLMFVYVIIILRTLD